MLPVAVVGGANVDVKARTTAALVGATSNPGAVSRSAGGVGRNIAENLARLGHPVSLLSVVGDDADGDWLLERTAAAGVTVSSVRRTGRTGAYVAVLDDAGELAVAVADMAATDAFSPDDLDLDALRAAAMVVLDGNLTAATVAAVLDAASRAGVPVVVDPVSVAKAARIAPLLGPDRPVHALTPNHDELVALGGSAAALHGRGAELVWVRHGRDGSVLSTAAEPTAGTRLPAPLVDPAEVVDVTGAGDASIAAFCHRLLAGDAPAEAAAYGHRAAALTVASPHTVRPDLRERMGS
nr:carbohydrate kinase family protein [Nocardioides flavescens]